MGTARSRVILLALVALASCARTERGGRTDREALLSAAREDGRTVAVLREVEALVGHDDRARAIVRLREAALPAADRALTAAEDLELGTGAGRAAKDELLGVLHLRREAIEAYLAAVEARDDLRLLDAIRKQREVEVAIIEWEQTATKVGRAASESGCGS